MQKFVGENKFHHGERESCRFNTRKSHYLVVLNLQEDLDFLAGLGVPWGHHVQVGL